MSAVYRALAGPKPVLLDVPFKERELRAELEALGAVVHPFFVVAPVEVVKERYAARGHGELPKASVTRATSIINRANEWAASYGSSAHILSLLRQV